MLRSLVFKGKNFAGLRVSTKNIRRLFSSEGVSLEELRKEPRDIENYDVVIVGGGPAGLATAIKLKQLEAYNDEEISVCLIEKGSEIGSHILSGN